MCNEKEMFKDHHHHQVDNHMQQMLHIEPQVNTASADPTFLSERCLENLLKSEETHPSLINFYNNPQCEITPKMRRIVAEWMMEVSFQFQILFDLACQSIGIQQIFSLLFAHIMQLSLLTNICTKRKIEIEIYNTIRFSASAAM